jgi:hypothetical protein
MKRLVFCLSFGSAPTEGFSDAELAHGRIESSYSYNSGAIATAVDGTVRVSNRTLVRSNQVSRGSRWILKISDGPERVAPERLHANYTLDYITHSC